MYGIMETVLLSSSVHYDPLPSRADLRGPTAQPPAVVGGVLGQELVPS